MTIFITIIHIIVCLVLILVILVQGGRGQGITGPSFGSGNVQSLFGTRAGDFLTKATSISAICFLFTCIGLNMIEARKSRSLLEASRPQAPVDIDALKKALEKIKNEKGEIPAVTTEKAADGSTVVKVTQDKPFGDAAATAEVQKILDEAAKKAAAAAPETKTAAEPKVEAEQSVAAIKAEEPKKAG